MGEEHDNTAYGSQMDNEVINVRRDYVLVFSHSIRLFFNRSETGITLNRYRMRTGRHC